MVQNAPKHEFRVQWGWIGCVRCEQFWCNFMARTFRNKSTRSTPLDPKLMFWCVSYHRVRSLRKIPTWLHGTNFCTSLAYFTPSFVRQPNGLKWYETHQNMSLGSNGVDRVHSLRNDSTQLRGTNFCTSSESFAPSFIRQLPKCTQKVRNAPKHEFRVQWGGSGAFVAKNSDSTSWHELLQ